MKNHKVKELTEFLNKRYTERHLLYGKDVKSLGWGNEEQQTYRFKNTLSQSIDFSNKRILDIGCGYGDYLNYIKTNNQTLNFKSYKGYDINDHFIKTAKKIYSNEKRADFEVNDILFTENHTLKNNFDLGIMLGLLNLNFKNKVDNYVYSKNMIKSAFKKLNEVLIVDFLSIYRTEKYEKEDFVFYYDPSRIIKIISELTSNFVINHNYSPIPQKEFMIFIYK